MGYECCLMVVKPVTAPPPPEAMRDGLGFDAALQAAPTKFQTGPFQLWVGQIGNCVILDFADSYLLMELEEDGSGLKPEGRELLEKIMRLFPGSDIGMVFLQSVVAGFGYAVFERGELVRCCTGMDQNVLCEYGRKLPFEEQYLLANFEPFEKDGAVLHRRKPPLWAPEDFAPQPHGAFGEELTDELFRVFTGRRIGWEADQDLLDLVGVGFSGPPHPNARPAHRRRTHEWIMVLGLAVVMGLLILFSWLRR